MTSDVKKYHELKPAQSVWFSFNLYQKQNAEAEITIQVLMVDIQNCRINEI